MIRTKSFIIAGMVAGIACAALFFPGARSVHAQTVKAATVQASAASSTDCGVTPADLAQITAVQNDPTLTPSQEVVQELAIRKQLIIQVIMCAQGEVQSLQSSLSAVPKSTDAEQSIKSQLQGRINDASSFYTLELGKLGGAGIAGTKTIAGEVLAWREGTFLPLEGQVGDFILWAGNQQLFSTAQERMTETQQAVSFIESASNNADLQSAFNAAYASFETAKNGNAAAEAGLQQSLPPGQTLVLIKQSLDALQATYQQFFKVSDIIQSLLPQ